MSQIGLRLHDRRPTPLCIYLCWHSDFLLGRNFAKDLWEWMRGARHEILGQGLGIPLYYRTHHAYALPTPEGREPDPLEHFIRLQDATLNVIVPLIDAHMIKDTGWQECLRLYVRREKERNDIKLFPVMLHASASNIAPELRRINYIRITTEDADFETVADVNSRMQRGDKVPNPLLDSVQKWKMALRRYVTSAICREVRNRWFAEPQDESSDRGILEQTPLPLKIFVSHAKKDGRAIASRLRRAVYQYGQLEAFFDEADLPVGYDFEEKLELEVEKSSAALIAISTDFFSLRSWTKREISLARRPVPHPNTRTLVKSDDVIYYSTPVIAVDARTKYWSPAPAELSNVPTLYWDPQRAEEILDRLLLETLLAHVWCQRGVNHSLSVNSDAGTRRLFLSWTPDEYTILALKERMERDGLVPRIRQNVSASVEDISKIEIYYPGRSLPKDKEDRLLSVFSPSVSFRTYQPYLDGPDEIPNNQHTVIGVTCGDWKQSSSIGYSLEHIDELTVNICANLMNLGYRICYSGYLRLREENAFSKVIYEVARTIVQDLEGRAVAPLLNPQAWDYHEEWSVSDEAHRHGVLELVRVDPIGPESAGFKTTEEAKPWWRAVALAWARAAVHMDDPPPLGFFVTVRVAFGGAWESGAGRIPGVAEEILAALRHNTPLLVLGGLAGGCCEAITRYLLGMAQYPSFLTSAWQSKQPNALALEKARKAAKLTEIDHVTYEELSTWTRRPASEILDELRQQLGEYRQRIDELRTDKALRIAGLNYDEHYELMTTRSLRTACELIAVAVERITNAPSPT